ncbi:hypothetical protein KJ657_00935 [Patescibacteria group bacterium]|nr:hypothetical protein [Patescibacteria group bacterium]MBU1015635.1 hypothetical protein [Patescibacteria group bacterium]MBU1684988.1 hypothetical protein [Patescibacteria group bacterium]MBU1938530.1 hypothetical protein [Patescibacteria group bacterium]
MEINLSWDLFVIVFFAVIIAYSFIIGRNQTLKIIIASYIAILTADGIGNLIRYYFIGENAATTAVNLTNEANELIVIKIFIFVLTIVLVSTRGRFTMNMSRPNSSLMNVILTLTYGVLSAGLITSTILIYTSGSSLVQETNMILNEAILAMYRNSVMVQTMINNYNIWFSLPAITFVISSFLGEEVDA